MCSLFVCRVCATWTFCIVLGYNIRACHWFVELAGVRYPYLQVDTEKSTVDRALWGAGGAVESLQVDLNHVGCDRPVVAKYNAQYVELICIIMRILKQTKI